MKRKKIFQTKILIWYSTNKRNFPWRYTYDPYKVMVSEILLQRTQAQQVIDPYNEILFRYKNIKNLSEAEEKDLLILIKNIGLHKRAAILKNISKEIVQKYSGIIPRKKDSLIKIKGIGNYTANSILCFGYNKPYGLIDTNISRIYIRFFDLTITTKRVHADKNLWNFAEGMIPSENYVDYNYALLDFGALICKKSKPLCSKCAFSKPEICSYFKNIKNN
jgi:A/G-specific adenine glycosylase